LIAISGIWIVWVSIRLIIRERCKYLVWAHYALGALAFGGLVTVAYAFLKFPTR
jgi:hypothetical protein